MEASIAPFPFPATVDKTAINHLPLFRYDGPITLVSSQDGVRPAIEVLAESPVLGFDTETRPTFQKGQSFPPALLQLAGHDHVFLFQLAKLDDLAPLFRILSDPDVLKVGIALHDDVKKLQSLLEFPPCGFLELSTLSTKAGIVNTGLRALSAILLGSRVSKGAQVTNWSRSQLTAAQIQYAATDAWVSRVLYVKMLELGMVPEEWIRPV